MAKDVLPCVKPCRRTTGLGRTSVAASFPVGRADRIQVKKAQNSEPHLRLPYGDNSDGHAAQVRNAQIGVNQVCPPSLRGGLLRKAVRRGHMARPSLDALPKSEKENKEDVTKLMALTN